ncbi:MAG: hypothetical protein C0508_06850, partial [Cyanobacteria bacterium PR.023]|nr:hypothetical protein [Cyanobacteria bacterium PR.023]
VSAEDKKPPVVDGGGLGIPAVGRYYRTRKSRGKQGDDASARSDQAAERTTRQPTSLKLSKRAIRLLQM